MSIHLALRRTGCPALVGIFLFFFLAHPSEGQVAPGFPSYLTQDCHGIDCVDLLNNNVSLTVPVMSKAGAIPFSYVLNGSYYISKNTSTTTWQSSELLPAATAPLTEASSAPGYTTSGWSGGGFGLCPDGVTRTTEYWGFYFVIAGTYHYLPSSDFTDVLGCYQKTITDAASDGSGYVGTFNLHSLVSIYDAAGNHIGQGSITDPNGNAITFTSSVFTDTLGLTVLTVGSGNFPSYTWTDVNAGAPAVSFTTSSTAHLKSVFGCSGVSDFDVTNQTLPSAINFPDGRSLGITYEATVGYSGDVTGRLNQITLPELGTVAYTYGGSNNGFNCTYQTVPVLTRTQGNGDTTTYTLAYSLISGSNYKVTNTVVDKGGNHTVYTFTGLGPSGNSTSYMQVLTEVQHYLGASTLLTTDVYCYKAFSACSPSTAPTAQVTSVGAVTVFHQINGMSTWSAKETYIDIYGNVYKSTAYDFGASSPTTSTTTTYGSCSASCRSLSPTISAITNIYNRPGEVVTTQNGSTVAQTNYTYDTKGNLLSTSKWTGSAWIGQTSSNVYNPNGTPSKTYDVANNETDYSYAAGSYVDCSGCTQYPFPTQVKDVGTGDYVNTVWHGTGGVKSTDTDRNGNTITYCYNSGNGCSGGTADPYWRVLQTVDPYGSSVLSNYPTSSSPAVTNTSFTFNSANSINSTTITTDGYKRTINSQTAQSPSGSNYDTVTTAYGWATNYQTVSTSQPCSTTSGANCTTVHTSEYDPLGRLYSASTTSNETLTHTYTQNDDLSVLTPAPIGENSKQVQTESDGLGRVSKICQIGSTASTGSGTACAQNTGSANGTTDAYSYTQGTGYTESQVTRNGTQVRTNYYDALGRLYQNTTPEAGTWNYYFDSYSTCPTGYKGSSGQLTAIKDPNGNLTCYSYDTLNRITGVNANGTSCRHFYYDNSTGYSGTLPTGVTLANPYQRMVEAATDSCSPGTLITDEWFAYDDDGRVAGMWQWSAHSTQYYHSTATFFENGATKALSLANPSLYTFTYGLDGEGRWNTLTDTTNVKTLVAGATFYPAANPAVITFTGTPADTDSYTYDSNTGLMTQYVFSMGSGPTTMTGALTWNPDRTLKKLTITDGFDAGGTQTCHYNPTDAAGTGYDDWGRLIGMDCGSGGWGQTFSYDQYDNLNKAVISGRTGTTWSSTYSSSNNHYTCSGCTYDSNGNVTNDGNNAYTWNEFSKLKGVANGGGTFTCGSSGQCLTYDAFGRPVEFVVGSTWTEIWYTQAPTVYMNGSTVLNAYWPSIEGGAMLIPGNAASYHYLHPDWQGSARLSSLKSTHTLDQDQAYTPYGERYDTFGNYSQYDLFGGMSPALFDQGVTRETPNRELSVVGRWLSPDPARTGWNQYAYPTDPNSNTDPTGLCSPRDIYGQCYVVGQDASRATNPMNAQCISIDGGGACALFTGSPFDYLNMPIRVFWCKEGVCDYYHNGDSGIIGGNVQCYYVLLEPCGYAANNGPCGGADCTAVQRGMLQMVWKPPLAALRQAAKGYLCGSSPANNIRNWTIEGGAKGTAVGAIAGGVTGTVLGTPVGGFFGAILGGLIDGTVTAGGGVFGGSAASVVCSSLGMYSGS